MNSFKSLLGKSRSIAIQGLLIRTHTQSKEEHTFNVLYDSHTAAKLVPQER